MIENIPNINYHITLYNCLGKLCLRESLIEQVPCSSFQKGSKFSFPISTVRVSSKGFQFLNK